MLAPSPTLCILTIIGLVVSCNSELHDLSYGFDDSTISWIGHEQFRFTNVIAEERLGGFYSANQYASAEHSGTHMDAPYHFYKEGMTIEQIPINNLFVTGVLVNVSLEVNGNADYLMSPEPFKKWEEVNGPMPDNSVVLVCFGWAHRYPNRTLYLGSPTSEDLHFPGLSVDAARWLVDSKKVVGIGTDTALPDVPSAKDFPVHRVLSEKNIYILENVALLEELPPSFEFIVLPMKIVNGTGAPTRLVAKTKPVCLECTTSAQ